MRRRALFSLGLGQGMPLMAVGRFGSAVPPKLGPWMESVRRMFGFVFPGFTIRMAWQVLPDPSSFVLFDAARAELPGRRLFGGFGAKAPAAALTRFAG